MRILTTLALLCTLALPALATAGNISQTNKYAWSETTGWSDFAPPSGGVTVYADHLEGSVWEENVGWIKLGSHTGGGAYSYANSGASDWGVNCAGNGALSGFGWSDTVGWINFAPASGGVTIDPSSGALSGYAWGENFGWIRFKNDAIPYGVAVVKASQNISFGLAPAISVGGAGTVSATATSGLTVTFSSSTPGICTVSGDLVTGVSAGTCAITASQAGNTDYAAALPSSQSFTITPAGGPTVSTLKPTGLVANGAPYRASASSVLTLPTKGMLNGLVNPNGDSCTVSFDYGPTTAYGSSASYGTVSGTSSVAVSSQVNFTWVTDGSDQSLHYRTKAVCSGGTWYGNDITFAPFTSTTGIPGSDYYNASYATANIEIRPTCSDSSTMANFDIWNYNAYDVTVDYTAGIGYSGNVIIGSQQVQQILVGKGSIVSFYYNYTLFEQILTNDRLCSEPQSPSSLVRVYALGNPGGDGQIYALYNDNATPITLEVMAGSDIFNVTIPARSGQLIATAKAEAQFSYNSEPFMVLSPLSGGFWANRYLVTAAPVSSTPTTSDFLLQNNDDTAHTVVLRSGGTEHRYTLPPYGSQQVTVEYGAWDLYLVVPGMTGPAMVGDHVKVASLNPGPQVQEQEVTGLVVNPAAPQQLVAGLFGAGIMLSSNGGGTWTPAPVQPASILIKALAGNPATPATLYAASYGSGIFKSSDSGTSWSNCSGQPANLNSVALTIDASGRLYTGTEGGIFTSSDCNSWSAINTGLTVDINKPALAIAVDPANVANLYAGLDGAGVFRSIDSGANWSAATTQPGNLRIKALAFKPGDSTNLYAATYGNGLFKSVNSGDSWAACGVTGLTDQKLLSLVIDGSGKLYAGSEAGVFVSADGCATWTAMNGGLP